MRILTVLLLACLSSATAAADVYRWTDDKGVVHYSDKPQSPADKPVALPDLQTYNHKASPPPNAPLADTPAAATPAKASSAPFAITSPAQDETIRDAEGQFTVTVSASLGPGQGIVYYLDGAAENKEPTPSTAFMISRVDRGEHTVSAALVDAGGNELERAGPVTVHIKPPTVKH